MARAGCEPMYPASAAVAVMRQLGLQPLDVGSHHSTWQDAKGRTYSPSFSLRRSDTVSHGELHTNGLALERTGICSRQEFIRLVKYEAGRLRVSVPTSKERRLEEAIVFATTFLRTTLKEEHARVTIINMLRRLAKNRPRNMSDRLLSLELERQEVNLKGLF